MINQVILVGRVGIDPVMKKFDNGNAVTRFSVATSRYYTKDGEKQEDTQWHNVNVWNKQAEIAEKYVTKGMLIYIQGEIRYRMYEGENGDKKYATDIVANLMKFLSKSENSEQTTEPVKTVPTQAEEENDDLPF